VETNIKEDFMSEKDIDKEVEAIRTVSSALQPLDDFGKQRVIDYVLKRFGLTTGQLIPPIQAPSIRKSAQDFLAETSLSEKITHIRQLKELKKPKTAIEMAALVAYFLSDLAPHNERKSAVTTKDMETYFKIANYRLPTALQQLLGNAKNAGYFDLVRTGEYKLNAVGYNLVVHNLPRGESDKSTGAKRSQRKGHAKNIRKRRK
jgi:hypothetical protein